MKPNATAPSRKLQLVLLPALTVSVALALPALPEPPTHVTFSRTKLLGTTSVTLNVPVATVNGPAVPVPLTVLPDVVMAMLAGSPLSLVPKVKIPLPPRAVFVMLIVPIPWLVKLQLPRAPPVVTARLPQPPLSAKPAALSSATPKLAPAAALTTNTDVVTPVTLLKVNSGGSPPPPLVVKLKGPGPPMVFLATVSVASPSI